MQSVSQYSLQPLDKGARDLCPIAFVHEMDSKSGLPASVSWTRLINPIQWSISEIPLGRDEKSHGFHA